MIQIVKADIIMKEKKTMTTCELSSGIQFSSRTLNLLKNFSSINSNILIKKGNKINTVSPMKNIMGKAEIDEDFPVEFGIWDLNKFLGTISLFKDPSFIFEDKCVTIGDNNNSSKVVYYYSDPQLLTTTDKEVQMPESSLHFTLKQEVLQEVLKASSVLQLPDMIISSSDNKVVDITLTDKKDKTSNTYTVNADISTVDVHDFNFILKVENIKIIPDTYIVNMSSKRASNFQTEDGRLDYWIALESDTTC